MLRVGVMQGIDEAETGSIPVGNGEVDPGEALTPAMRNLWDDEEE